MAELAGELVGTTGMIIRPPEGQLVRGSVAKSHRRRGIATLLHRCIEHAQQLRLAALIAYTQPKWPDASGFYLRHGFRIYGSDSVDVHLRRALASADR